MSGNTTADAVVVFAMLFAVIATCALVCWLDRDRS